ncbi:MAG: putative baseplate assembly protein, partial [Rivularia sp. (in: cyanobacteria)]
ALAIDEENKIIYAATASGIFRYLDEGKWQEINQGLVHQDVQVLAVNQNNGYIFAGTLNGGVFVSQNNGDWVPTGLNNADIQALVIDSEKNIFAGTFERGIYYSQNNGSTWEQITSFLSGTGTISTDDINVTGIGTAFEAELKVGDTINAGGQTRTIIAINENEQITVNASFRPDLSLGTTFTVNTGLTNLNITSLIIADNTIFAGTAGSGVFRSQDNGKRWQQVNNNLTDLEIRCLAINSNNNLFAGTAKGGVFRSTNQGDFWAPINQGLTNTDVQAIAIQDNNLILWGKGILISPDGLYTAPVETGDLLQVITEPVKLSEISQKWTLKDRNGFIGEVVTTTANDLKLQPAQQDDDTISEVCTIANPPKQQQNPVLELEKPLHYSYDPQTVVIYGNVVQATHGETISEVLGSGDGTTANQSFTLQKPPLTYIPAATATGTESTLEVRIDGILWQEFDNLYQKTPHLQAYIVRLADDGTASVTFGDGENGARLPTSEENAIATYRSGIGFDGQVAAESLTLLKKRPLGIVEVTNPLAATGAAPPESRDTARIKAPSKVRTLDRIVSLQDFEDFSRAFAGIGKAQAVPLWNGQTQLLHITIAAADGTEIDADSQLYNKLVEAIDSNRDPIQVVEVDSYEQLLFNLSAKLQLDSRYIETEVIQNIRRALSENFAFNNRDFGQNVTESEVIATIQNVEGVVAVDLDALYQLGKSKALGRSLFARKARWDEDENEALPAQLLLINLGGIELIF